MTTKILFFLLTRGKLPTEDLEEIAKELALPKNVTLDPSWYLQNMRNDPLKWNFVVSYGVLVIVTLHIIIYSRGEQLSALKQKLTRVFRTETVSPIPPGDEANVGQAKEGKEAKEESKFWGDKSMIVSAGQTLILVSIGLAFTVPIAIVRRISREDLDAINNGAGRMWIYISKISAPFSYQFLYPVFIILGNAKMRSSLARVIRESEFVAHLALFVNNLKIRLWGHDPVEAGGN